MPVSYALTGPVATAVGHTLTLALGGALSGAVWFVGLLWPRVRERERRRWTPSVKPDHRKPDGARGGQVSFRSPERAPSGS